MSKDKMVKVRLLNDGGFEDLKQINFPADVWGEEVEENYVTGIYVSEDMLGVICSTPKMNGSYWFGESEYELITEEETAPPQPQQTIEQLLDELAQVNADGLALAIRHSELLALLNPRLNPLGFTYNLINK